ncbi:MAG: Mrp/NBP35 family ATP-binding protein [Ignavibacteriota bacterium]
MKNLIAVGSGKGGVGKTTVAVNLAVGLAKLGYKAGLMDADVYGPNVPLMMGVNSTPMANGDRIQPLVQFGVKLMSMGFLNPGDKPLVWRGPMLHSVIQQFLRGVDWGELDYLVIDLPPGTGDVQLSLIQTAPITGAIVVTTPSDVSLEDARKAIHMFHQVRVPILGIVENMSYLQCPHCNERIDVFSHGGGRRTAEQMQVHFLAELPLDPQVRVGGDSGQPVVLSEGQGAAFLELARNAVARTAQAAEETGPPDRDQRLEAFLTGISPTLNWHPFRRRNSRSRTTSPCVAGRDLRFARARRDAVRLYRSPRSSAARAQIRSADFTVRRRPRSPFRRTRRDAVRLYRSPRSSAARAQIRSADFTVRRRPRSPFRRTRRDAVRLYRSPRSFAAR